MSNYDSTNRARRITNKTLSEPSFIFFSLSLALSIRVFCVTIREMDSGRTRCLRDSMYIYFVFFDIAELNWRRYLGGFHWLVESVCILFVYFYKRRMILVWRKRFIRIILYAIQINRNSFEVQVYRLLEI